MTAAENFGTFFSGFTILEDHKKSHGGCQQDLAAAMIFPTAGFIFMLIGHFGRSDHPLSLHHSCRVERVIPTPPGPVHSFMGGNASHMHR
jgi:hypothetical protein